MLPDLPELKNEILDRFHTIFQQRVNAYMGVMGEVPRCYIKEGRRTVIIRPDGKRDETVLKKASAETSIDYELVPHMSLEERINRLDKAAQEMARQISEHGFETIKDAVDQSRKCS